MALNYSFGYNLRLWVFSGRRGIHCWVSDPEAKRLNDFKRKFLIEFLNSGPKLHTPFIEINKRILEQAFEEIIVNDQGLFDDPTHMNTVVELIVEGGISRNDLFKDQGHVSGRAFWQLIKSKNLQPLMMMKIYYKFLYPRLDVHVSTSTNHLLKSPFSIHPATCKVCIPFDARLVDSFDLDLVPTVEEAIEGSSEFTKAIQYFETFLHEVMIRGLAEKSKYLEFVRENQEKSDYMEIN
jgi:DNA primase small subunit